jgi:hypothetical protein
VLLDDLLLGPLLLLIIICPDPDEVVGTTSNETFLRRNLTWVWGTGTGVVGSRDY